MIRSVGASKERFFVTFGFRIEEWERLADALREHGRKSGFGPRYEVEGELSTPDGRRPRVRTVGQLDEGEVAPQLITTYPLEASHD